MRQRGGGRKKNLKSIVQCSISGICEFEDRLEGPVGATWKTKWGMRRVRRENPHHRRSADRRREPGRRSVAARPDRGFADGRAGGGGAGARGQAGGEDTGSREPRRRTNPRGRRRVQAPAHRPADHRRDAEARGGRVRGTERPAGGLTQLARLAAEGSSSYDTGCARPRRSTTAAPDQRQRRHVVESTFENASATSAAKPPPRMAQGAAGLCRYRESRTRRRPRR